MSDLYEEAFERGRKVGAEEADDQWADLLERVEFFELHEGDTLVLSFDRHLSPSEADEARARLKAAVPNNRTVLVDGGIAVEIQRG